MPQDYAQSVHWWRKAAEQGHVDAQSNLGWAYLNGRGVPQDDAQAVHWYRKAAEQGHANAQFALGKAYEYGKGVPQEYSEAVRWYREAAEQSDANAQMYLGAAYFSGHGVPQDRVEAHKPRWTAENRQFLDRSKPAISGRPRPVSSTSFLRQFANRSALWSASSVARI